MMTGINLVHIPYRDSYWPDLLAGQTQILFAPVISATGYVQSGQLRALAVTTRTRLEAMPAAEPKSYVDAFVKALQTLGWHDGQNVRLDIRWNAGDPEHIRSYAEVIY